MNSIMQMAIDSRKAAEFLVRADAAQKNKALKHIAGYILSAKKQILEENKKDLENAKKKGISDALLDRLMLNEARIENIAMEIGNVVAIDDPVGEKIESKKMQNGLKISKIRVPLGVIGIIYESRPNVTVDAATLCLKSGNAVILRGGSDAINSNKALADTVRNALKESGFPENAVQLIEDTDRERVNEMLKLHGFIDVIIPRGSGSLIQMVIENSKIPVIETGEGNCHIFVDASADLAKATRIIINAKTQRPGVCNAAEKLLVHKDIANKFLPSAIKELRKSKVEIRGCERTKKIVNDIKLATEADWPKEYLDLIIAIKIVDSVDAAIAHINKYSTKHSDAILSNDGKNIEKFLKEIDSACVYANASTRFTDGAQFGLGSEIGISTQKLHARGPMGLKELTTYKYLIEGSGQIRG